MSYDHPNCWTGRLVFVLRYSALRATQVKFAEQAKISPRTVSKYESNPDFVLSGAFAKKMDRILLALTDDQRARFRSALSEDEHTATLTPGNVDGLAAEEVDLMALARKGFLLGVANPVGSTALTSQWLSSAGHVPLALAEALRSTAGLFRAAYVLAPARQLLAAAHSHLQLVLSLRPGDQPEPIRSHLLTVVGEMATLAGTILGFDLQDWENSGPYLRVAQSSAAESGNNELRAVVAACNALHAAYRDDDRRDLKLALDYAESARSIAAQGGSPTTQGWVAAVTSERHADMGQAMQSLRLLEEARVALAGPPVEETRYSGIGVFDMARLAACEGSNYRRIGDFNRAVAILDAALTQLDPSFHRHRASALVDRAEAHRDGRHFDAACADARTSLVLVSFTQDVRTLGRVMHIAKSVHHSGGLDSKSLWNDVLAVKATIGC